MYIFSTFVWKMYILVASTLAAQSSLARARAAVWASCHAPWRRADRCVARGVVVAVRAAQRWRVYVQSMYVEYVCRVYNAYSDSDNCIPSRALSWKYRIHLKCIIGVRKHRKQCEVGSFCDVLELHWTVIYFWEMISCIINVSLLSIYEI